VAFQRAGNIQFYVSGSGRNGVEGDPSMSISSVVLSVFFLNLNFHEKLRRRGHGVAEQRLTRLIMLSMHFLGQKAHYHPLSLSMVASTLISVYQSSPQTSWLLILGRANGIMQKLVDTGPR
jgi:hypothetical protein